MGARTRKRGIRRLVAALGLAWVVLPVPCRADVVIVEEGEARAVICAEPGLMEERGRLRASVEDLAHYIGEMSGARPERRRSRTAR